MILLEHQNIKTFLQKAIPNSSEEVFVIKKVKNTVSWIFVISDVKGKEVVGTFCEKELQKTNLKKFIAEKVIREKTINYMLNGKATIALLTVGLVKNDIL